MENRDDYIVAEYRNGRSVEEIARQNGLTPRRIKQILSGNHVVLRRKQAGETKPISRMHELIGLHLYFFRDDQGMEAIDAANKLGWSLIRFRKIERGVMELELLELLDILAFTKSTLEDIIKNGDTTRARYATPRVLGPGESTSDGER